MSFEMTFPPVSFLQFWITLALGAALIFIIGLYMLIFVWTFGKPMLPYLTAKLTPGFGIIQEYIYEYVFLKIAKEKNGEFTDTHSVTFTEKIPVNRKWYQFFKPKEKIINHYGKPIIGKSIVSINGVKTLLIWNVNPKLPERYLKALELIVKEGYNSIDEMVNSIVDFSKIIPETNDPMTYTEFLDLHEKIRNKNIIIVTPDDVLGFSDKYLDEHAKKSVIEKEVTVAQKRAGEKVYQKYAFYIVGIMVVGGFIMLAWKIKYGGGTP